MNVEIDEFVGSWLEFDESERSFLGKSNALLGVNLSLGASIFSVQDKIRIRIFTKDMAQYMRFLPSGDLCKPLADGVFFYIGDQLDWEVELAIPAGAVEPMQTRTVRVDWLDKLDIAQLDVSRSHSPRCAVPSG